MLECRKRAFKILSTTNTEYNITDPISDLQPLSKSQIYANSMCDDFIRNSTEHDYGFMIYLKYKSSNVVNFPLVEDLHLGRVCCSQNKTISNSFIAAVNCVSIN